LVQDVLIVSGMSKPSHKIVHFEYELRKKGGEPIEASDLHLVAGGGALLPAIEELVMTLPVGREVYGELTAPEAFGNETLLPTRDIPLSEFPSEETPVLGKVYIARTVDGDPVRFRVEELTASDARVRLLHWLSDVDLEYRIKVIDRDSTAIMIEDSIPISVS
jgi:FKBP-type peptidyl-prolyl cis-trans isomerase 2